MLNGWSIDRFNELLECFIGTKNFHNFTTEDIVRNYKREKKSSHIDTENDIDADGHDEESHSDHKNDEFRKLPIRKENILFSRNIHKIEITNQVTLNGDKYHVIVIKGNSFLKHQIRKMIGAALCVINDLVPGDFIDLALNSNVKILTPMVPGEGLLLDTCAARERKNTFYINLNDSHIIESQQKMKNEVIYPTIAQLLNSPTNSLFSDFFDFAKNNVALPDEKYEKIKRESQEFIEWREEYRKGKHQRHIDYLSSLKELSTIETVEKLLPSGFRLKMIILYPSLNSSSITRLIDGLGHLLKQRKIKLKDFATVETLVEFINNYNGGYEAIINLSS